MKAALLILGFSSAVLGTCRGKEGLAMKGSQGVSLNTRLLDSIIHLGTDSVEFQSSGPAAPNNSPPGLLITFHPFVPIQDTLHDRAISFALFYSILSRLDSAPPPFVALRAVDQPAAVRNGVGVYAMHALTVVVERRSDRRWYRLGESTPIPVP